MFVRQPESLFLEKSREKSEFIKILVKELTMHSTVNKKSSKAKVKFY